MPTSLNSSLETFKTMPQDARKGFIESLTDAQRTAYLQDLIEYYHGFYSLRRKYGKDSWARLKQKKRQIQEENSNVEKKLKCDIN